MSLDKVPTGVQISAGSGIVARVGNFTALAKDSPQSLRELVARVDALAQMPWREAVNILTTWVREVGHDEDAALACALVETEKVSAFVFGPIELTVIIDGETKVLDGHDSTSDVVLRGEVNQVHTGKIAREDLVGVLRNGAVPAAGFLLKPTVLTTTAQADQPLSTSPLFHGQVERLQTLDGPASPGLFTRLSQLSSSQPSSFYEAVNAGGLADRKEAPSGNWDGSGTITDEDGEPISPTESPFDVLERQVAAREAAAATATTWKERPELRGITCPEGHFTSSYSRTCRTCASPLEEDTPQIRAKRPVLGHLVFDDGAVLDIDRPVVMGSGVPSGYTVHGEPTTVVRLDDGRGGIADIQLELRISGWDVEVVDMASQTGTYSMLQGQRQTRTRLRSGQEMALQDATTIEIGTRTFTFGFGPHLPD